MRLKCALSMLRVRPISAAVRPPSGSPRFFELQKNEVNQLKNLNRAQNRTPPRNGHATGASWAPGAATATQRLCPVMGRRHDAPLRPQKIFQAQHIGTSQIANQHGTATGFDMGDAA
jgi:hypothetical protein